MWEHLLFNAMLRLPEDTTRAAVYRCVIGWMRELGRGLHSFTSQLNLSAFYGIGSAVRVGVVWPMLRGCYGVCRVCRVFLFVRHCSS